MIKIESITRGQVIRENGTLQGQTDSMPTHTAVATTNIRLPLTVQTPPHLELLFQSYSRRYESITPAIITSSVGSHEHFLQRLLTKSGTQKNRGEESYPAQSLQESGNVKCRITAKMVVLVTMMIIEKKACFKDLKWKSLMLPTQMQPAIKQQQTQFSIKSAITVIISVKLPLMRSQILTLLNTTFLNFLNRNTTQFKQMKTKKIEIMIPEYRIARKATFLSLAENRVKPTIATLPTTLNIRKGTHLSQKRSGLRLTLMDQMWECMATPTIIAALMKEMIMQPIQNCLCLPSGSQLSRKLKILLCCSMKDTSLKQS